MAVEADTVAGFLRVPREVVDTKLSGVGTHRHQVAGIHRAVVGTYWVAVVDTLAVASAPAAAVRDEGAHLHDVLHALLLLRGRLRGCG